MAKASPTGWTKEKINELLLSNPKACERALVVLYNRQTNDEKNAEATIERNGVGFGAYDAEFMSSLARRVLGGRGLTPNMLRVLRKQNKSGICKLAHYHRQLIDEIERKAGEAK